MTRRRLASSHPPRRLPLRLFGLACKCVPAVHDRAAVQLPAGRSWAPARRVEPRVRVVPPASVVKVFTAHVAWPVGSREHAEAAVRQSTREMGLAWGDMNLSQRGRASPPPLSLRMSCSTLHDLTPSSRVTLSIGADPLASDPLPRRFLEWKSGAWRGSSPHSFARGAWVLRLRPQTPRRVFCLVARGTLGVVWPHCVALCTFQLERRC